MAKRIVFVLPGHGGTPAGGYKVVYEYANCMVSRGYDVSIVHPVRCDSAGGLFVGLKKTVRYLQRSLDKSHLPNKWFSLDRRVTVLWVPSLQEKYIPDADVVVATAWRTAEWVANYDVVKGRKYYLIQSYESWDGPDDRVRATWTLPMHKIVIARWLAEIAIELGEEYSYVPNGLDFSKFNMDKPIEERDGRHVMMLYHERAWKGTKDGLRALAIARKTHPDLKVTLFGVPEAQGLPEWVSYYRQPSQDILRNLYNRAAIFLSPSLVEGWALPPAEAMMCGCALVATDIGGHRDYAEHGQTALMSKPNDPISLADNLVRLMRNPDERIRMAYSGNDNIQKYTWPAACARFERVISDERVPYV